MGSNQQHTQNQTNANQNAQQAQNNQQQQQNTVITIPGTNNTIQIPSNFAGKNSTMLLTTPLLFMVHVLHSLINRL